MTSDPGERRRRLGEFLKAKRAAIAPDAFGLPVHRRRRVEGLRREEVAALAGISLTWYTQLESGAEITVSPALVNRLADIFKLTPLERAYLFALAIDELGTLCAIVPEFALIGDRIAAETFEGEIALVLRTHRTLKTSIYSSIVHGTIDALRPHLDETRCPIGIWLHDDLAPCRHRDPNYTHAARVHAAFHREIDRVIDAACAAGPTEQLERMIVAPSSYARVSEELEHAFGRWRQFAS